MVGDHMGILSAVMFFLGTPLCPCPPPPPPLHTASLCDSPSFFFYFYIQQLGLLAGFTGFCQSIAMPWYRTPECFWCLNGCFGCQRGGKNRVQVGTHECFGCRKGQKKKEKIRVQVGTPECLRWWTQLLERFLFRVLERHKTIWSR